MHSVLTTSVESGTSLLLGPQPPPPGGVTVSDQSWVSWRRLSEPWYLIVIGVSPLLRTFPHATAKSPCPAPDVGGAPRSTEVDRSMGLPPNTCGSGEEGFSFSVPRSVHVP